MAGAKFTEAVNEWTNTKQRVVRREEDTIVAKEEHAVACSKLGSLLAPSDMKVGEVICVWVSLNRKQERMLELTKTPNTYTLRFRGEIR